MLGNSPVRFLGEEALVTTPPYPTKENQSPSILPAPLSTAQDAFSPVSSD